MLKEEWLLRRPAPETSWRGCPTRSKSSTIIVGGPVHPHKFILKARNVMLNLILRFKLKYYSNFKN